MKLLAASRSVCFLRSAVHCNDETLPMPLISVKCKTRSKHAHFRLVASNSKSKLTSKNERRSANYHPTIWDPKSIESLTTPYKYELHSSRLEELKSEVRIMLKISKEPSSLLNLIDSIQRLGVAYHFQEEIEETLNLVGPTVSDDLYTTALHFRLLREHGFPVSSDVFDKFRDENGKFMDNLKEDGKGLLSLYNALHLGNDGDDALAEAYDFCNTNLKSLKGRLNNTNLESQVVQALDMPLPWRMTRMEAITFIKSYQNDDTKNLVLLELAKLDYNLVQSVYQKELMKLARWWRDLRFNEKLHFTRDRLMENYLWAMGMVYEPHYSKCRIVLTKFVCILTAIDDMYDIYGSLAELEQFTDAVKRWDISAMEELPEYMKTCYFAMFNFVDELILHDVNKHEELNILPHLKNAWINLCEAYLKEARWFYGKHIPTLEEYLENARTSVGGPAAIVHSFMLAEQPVSQSSLNCLTQANDLISWSSIITRLSDDLGTFSAESMRGDVKKSIECYMIEENASEEEAKEHVKLLINGAWKKVNEEISNRRLPKSLVNMSLNMARTALWLFQYGDGIGTSIGITKDRISSLIVEPISFELFSLASYSNMWSIRSKMSGTIARGKKICVRNYENIILTTQK